MEDRSQGETGRIRPLCPCFTSGVSIMTGAGPRLIETLRPGDRVVTRDNGLQELIWIGARKLSWQTLGAEPQLQPILIQQGSLGPGLPDRDMLVSPRHRMLVERGRSPVETAEPEALVAAHRLVDNRTICPIEAPGITYVHILFERHEVVLANGAWTESFQPSAAAVGALDNAQMVELGRMFPDLAGLAAYAPARPSIRPRRPERPAAGRLGRPVPHEPVPHEPVPHDPVPHDLARHQPAFEEPAA